MLEIQSNGDATAITNVKNYVVPIEKPAVAAGNGQHSQSNVTRRNLLFM
jgi:hypothetical protein